MEVLDEFSQIADSKRFTLTLERPHSISSTLRSKYRHPLKETIRTEKSGLNSLSDVKSELTMYPKDIKTAVVIMTATNKHKFCQKPFPKANPLNDEIGLLIKQIELQPQTVQQVKRSK